MIKEQDTMIKLLQVLFPGVKIYLFGSRARKTNAPESDIDLALDIGRETTFQELGRARRVLDSLHLILKIDVVDMCSISDDLKNTILKEGILWTS